MNATIFTILFFGHMMLAAFFSIVFFTMMCIDEFRKEDK